MSTMTFLLTGRINLSARLGHGSLTVHCRDDLEEATVELSADAEAEDYLERVTVEMRGPTLTVHAPRQGGVFDLFSDRARAQASVDAVVTVPTGTALKLATFTADIDVDGRCGGADIATGHSRVTLDRVDGDLRLRGGNPRVSVGDVTGTVSVRAGAGETRLGAVGGALQIGTGSGVLEAASVRGPVKSRSGNGEILLGAVYGDVDLGSGSGRMRIGLPAGVPARLDLQSGSGTVHSDLPVGDRPAADPAKTGNAITVRARTGSGDVSVFRSNTAVTAV